MILKALSCGWAGTALLLHMRRGTKERWGGEGLTGRHPGPDEHLFPPELDAALRATAPGCSHMKGLRLAPLLWDLERVTEPQFPHL